MSNVFKVWHQDSYKIQNNESESSVAKIMLGKNF